MMANNQGDGTPDFDSPGRMLSQAAIYDNSDLMNCLLQGEEAQHINIQDNFGRTALHTAVTNNSFNCFKILIERGADPNIACSEKFGCMTPLHQAALDGKTDFLRILLEHGADIEKEDASGDTPLSLAHVNNNTECIQLLNLEAERRRERKQEEFQTLLKYCQDGDVNKTSEILNKLGEDLKSFQRFSTPDSHTLLYSACMSGNPQMVELMLSHGAEAELDPVARATPLHAACQIGSRDIAKLLLEHFPSLAGVPSSDGSLPIHKASEVGSATLVSLLLHFNYPADSLVEMEAGDKVYKAAFNINANDLQQQTPLYVATNNKHFKTVQKLLKYRVKYYTRTRSDSSRIFGSDGTLREEDLTGSQEGAGDDETVEEEFCPVILDIFNKNGECALHCAVRNGSYDIISLLLAAGADINIQTKNDEKLTALILASENVNIRVLDLLLKHGAQDFDNKALFSNIISNQDKMVSALLKHRSHPDTEYHVNKLAAMQFVCKEDSDLLYYRSLDSQSSVSIPNVSVAIDWHDLEIIREIKETWLLSTSYFHNPRLTFTQKQVALFAISRIDVSKNDLDSLPPVIFQLQSLRILNVSHNRLSKLVSTMVSKQLQEPWQCPHLCEIHLHNNNLVELPVQLFSLPELTKLDVAYNNLENLPVEIWSAPKLSELNLAHNKLKSLPRKVPEDMSSSTYVESIAVDTGNQVDADNTSETTAAEEENGEKKWYKEIHVNHSNLWSTTVHFDDIEDIIDSKSSKSSQLRDLNLSGNLFAKCPEVLPCLAPTLQKLNLSRNQIREMAPPGQFPATLRWLDLSNNHIAKIGEKEETIPMLDMSECYSRPGQSLGISKNRARAASTVSTVSNSNQNYCIHQRHDKLDSLKTLILAENFISKVTLVTEKEENQEADNEGQPTSNEATKVRYIPKFPNLSQLDLSSNRIIDVPKSLSSMMQLTALNLRHNSIRELPPQLGRLKKLWNLDLKENVLVGPLQVMVEQKIRTADIIGFLGSILDDAKPYARMKLMFVGTEKIGKTTLLNCLRNEVRPVFAAKEPPPKHWSTRVSRTGVTSMYKDAKGEFLATVGVDIGDLTIDRNGKKVSFKTWDFGGQKEYYATHQYFLTRRSLYLVLWKITDGEKGVSEIKRWLINIQARAPGAPVIIIGTHLDELKARRFPQNFLPDLTRLIDNQFVNICEPEKSGLPQVKARIEVSCKKKDSIKKLVDLIHEKVFELTDAGSRSNKLLEQKIPAKYLELEDVVRAIAEERERQDKDPVLHADQYKTLVMLKMEEMFKHSFRDLQELNQATHFLHDNGVLLHYNDVSLRDMYFLDPQWLCDMLAHVVTVREINSLAKFGVMQTDDLQILFRNSAFRPEDIKAYIIGLLNKFEVALLWDDKHLLIPSLLPTEEELKNDICDVKIPMRLPITENRKSTLIPAKKPTDRRSSLVPPVLPREIYAGNSTFYAPSGDKNGAETNPKFEQKTDQQETQPAMERKSSTGMLTPSSILTYTSSPTSSLRRLYLMTYFPSGFWPRLITRLLADRSLYNIVCDMYKIPDVLRSDPAVNNLKGHAEWSCWQTGLELHLVTTLLRVKEVDAEKPFTLCDYRKCSLKWEGENNVWKDLNVTSMSILEIFLPNDVIVVKTESDSYDLPCNPKAAAKMLSKIVDHIDMLLEDWYPDLGVRFVHTSEGTYLVTRIVPCPLCVMDQAQQQASSTDTEHGQFLWSMVGLTRPMGTKPLEPEAVVTDEVNVPLGQQKQSQEGVIYCYMAEHLTQLIQHSKPIKCPSHDVLVSMDAAVQDKVAHIAPDLMFDDLGEDYQIKAIQHTDFLGRGSFGNVFAGTAENKLGKLCNAALKMLEPVNPGDDASNTEKEHYKRQIGMWEHDPTRCSCTAYSTARQELSILQILHHPNIVPLLGVCMKPMCLALGLAPQGNLKHCLKSYKRLGARLPLFVLKKLIMQISSAVEYLHSIDIIHRDLKAENVLVWSMPPPYIHNPQSVVDVKLTDYGVSRAALPNAAKGHAGTPAFIAPEILMHAGEEVYTSKVDCYSFGVVMYEIIALKRPYQNIEQSDLQEYVLAGNRPLLTEKDSTHYPTHVLDLMGQCWSHDPHQRPTAQQINCIASCPEFCHLKDCVSTECEMEVTAACGVCSDFSDQEKQGLEASALLSTNSVPERHDVWLSMSSLANTTSTTNIQVWTYENNTCVQGKNIISKCLPISCMYAAKDQIWCADEKGTIIIFSAKTYKEIARFKLPETLKSTVSVINFFMVPKSSEVMVSLSNGSILIYSMEKINAMPEGIKSNILPASKFQGSDRNIFCSAFIKQEDGYYELWGGQSEGVISIMKMNQLNESPVTVNHYEPMLEYLDVLFLETSPIDSSSVWSYVYPGSAVFRWDSKEKKLAAKADISRVIPQIDRLRGFPGFDGQLNPAQCQVSCLKVLNGQLFVGSTWGCIVVVDSLSMKVITVFRPHCDNVKAIVPLLPAFELGTEEPESASSNEMVVSLGKGYRNAMIQHLNFLKDAVSLDYDRNIPYLLTWVAEGWKHF